MEVVEEVEEVEEEEEGGGEGDGGGTLKIVLMFPYCMYVLFLLTKFNGC